MFSFTVQTTHYDYSTELAEAGRTNYSRFGNLPKNTLYTFYDERGMIFFGIARCKLKADCCVKSTGRTLAKQRAIEAFKEHGNIPPTKLWIQSGGLAGVCSKEFLTTVKDYFYSLDRHGDNGDEWL